MWRGTVVGHCLLWAGATATLGVTSFAAACGWDYETYFAEAKTLPCVYDVIVGYYQPHTEEYYETRIEAFDIALAWAPGWADGLDAKGISLLKLGRHDEAESVMARRLSLDEGAYPAHANLGTLYTFTGQFEKALAHIDRSMKIEPKAHFGREKFHRQLVTFLQAGGAEQSSRKNFLGVLPPPKDIQLGSEERFAEEGFKPDVFDALVSMIAVYGADEVPAVYRALGDAAALRGMRQLAWSAYERAIELGHPKKKLLRTRQGWLSGYIADASPLERVHPDELREVEQEDPLLGDSDDIRKVYDQERKAARKMQAEYAKWERQKIEGGLPIWSRSGLKEIYEEMNRRRRRCKAPSVIEDPQAPAQRTEEAEQPPPGTKQGTEK